jgi:ATP-dependent Zn protease
MTKQENSAMISIAYHEAGHAVRGRVLGLDCGSATIAPDDDAAGHAITADPWVTVAV